MELRIRTPGEPSRVAQGGLWDHVMHGLFGQVGKQFSRWKAPFASGIHSDLYLITDLVYNLFFGKKKIQQRVSFSDTGLERKHHSWAPSFLPSQEENNGWVEGSGSHPQLCSFLTEALNSWADDVFPVHLSTVDVHPEHGEAPCSLVLSWRVRRVWRAMEQELC